jgi:mRNA-degrading endonuclease HigB of HigAB toxin-antitoxin module
MKKNKFFKIGMVGSPKYEDKLKIKNVIFSIKKEILNAEICTRATLSGAEKYVKKYSLEFECNFKEFPPAHMSKTLYSAMSSNYYDKPYSPKNYFVRDSIFCKYIDKLIIFAIDGKIDEFENLLKIMKKLKKDVTLL